jgi:hypothetical protein
MQQTSAPRGIIYIAFGYEYILMALHSAETAKKTNPDIDFTIVSNARIRDIKPISQNFCSIYELEMADELNRVVKTSANNYATVEKTLLLDCDTEVNGDLTPMFRCLDGFDVLVKLNPRPTLKEFSIAPGLPGTLFPMWNTGAIFFKAGAQSERLFSEWHRIFTEMQATSDQPAFARAVYENPDLKLLSLNCLWNTFPDEVALLTGKRVTLNSKIWHYRDPSHFAPAARAIFALHNKIGQEFLRYNPESAAVDDVQSRYSLMTAWHRIPLLRKFIVGGTKSLRRQKKRTGMHFTRISSEH